MALSAQERRQWRELERQLIPEVPSVAERVEDHGVKRRTPGMAGSILAVVVVLAAFSVVILAVLVKVLLIGVLGFVLMILGGTRFQTPGRERQPAKKTNPASRDIG